MPVSNAPVGRVQCRIHGSWLALIPLHRGTDTVTIEIAAHLNYPRSERELKLVPNDELRWHENAASREDVDSALR